MRQLSPYFSSQQINNKLHSCPHCYCYPNSTSPQFCPHICRISPNARISSPTSMHPQTVLVNRQPLFNQNRLIIQRPNQSNGNIYYQRRIDQYNPTKMQENHEKSICNIKIVPNQYYLRNTGPQQNISMHKVNRIVQNSQVSLPHRVNIRFVSPAFANLNSHRNNSNQNSEKYASVEPRKPSILRQRKPGIRKMNSQSSQQKYPQQKQCIYYNQKQTKNKNLKSQKQVFNLYNSKVKKQENSDQSKKLVPEKIDNLFLTFSTNIPNETMDIVNCTPVKEDLDSHQLNNQKNEQNHNVDEIQFKEIKFNHDYYCKSERSDDSIDEVYLGLNN